MVNYLKSINNSGTRFIDWVLDKIKPRIIVKSMTVTYVAATLFQVLYNSFSEIAFLNFAIHFFWLLLNLINVLYNIFIPFCVIWFSSSIIIYSNPIHSLLALIFVFFNMCFHIINENNFILILFYYYCCICD